MKILLVGESSMLHNTLKKGLTERGHKVTLMSDGNDWHDSPRDINLRRNMRWGKLSGLQVLWNIFSNLTKVCGNDIVQLHNYTFVPNGCITFRYRWRFHMSQAQESREWGAL